MVEGGTKPEYINEGTIRLPIQNARGHTCLSMGRVGSGKPWAAVAAGRHSGQERPMQGAAAG